MNSRGSIYSLLWDKRLYTFPKGISPQVNVIARLEFELTYYNITVQNINHMAMATPLSP